MLNYLSLRRANRFPIILMQRKTVTSLIIRKKHFSFLERGLLDYTNRESNLEKNTFSPMSYSHSLTVAPVIIAKQCCKADHCTFRLIYPPLNDSYLDVSTFLQSSKKILLWFSWVALFNSWILSSFFASLFIQFDFVFDRFWGCFLTKATLSFLVINSAFHVSSNIYWIFHYYCTNRFSFAFLYILVRFITFHFTYS